MTQQAHRKYSINRSSSSSLLLLISTILGYPVLWFLVPLVYVLTKVSIYWFLLAFFGGGIAYWAFGNTALKLFSLIAIVPCLGAGLICLFLQPHYLVESVSIEFLWPYSSVAGGKSQ